MLERRVPTGGWNVERTAFGRRWVLRCQRGRFLADVVECRGGYDWRAMPPGKRRMRRGIAPSYSLACSAAEVALGGAEPS